MWCLVKPLITMVVFTVVFGNIAKLPSEGIPYPILVFAALLPWQFFSNAISDSSNSLLANSNLLSKVYFPRLIIPISSVMVSLVDFVISFFILMVLMAYYQFMPGWRILCIPVFMSVAISAALGAGFWFASLNVAYRDFRFIVPFVVQVGLFVSPVGFSSSIVPEKWHFLYSLNPMVAVIDGFRWVISGSTQSIDPSGMLLSSVISIFLLLSGLWFFRRTERSFADVI